jgi:hypothetical protein
MHSKVLDVQSFRAAECYTNHYLVVAKFWERLAVNKQTSHRLLKKRSNLKKVHEVEINVKYCVEVSSRFATLEDSDTGGN